MEVKKSIDAATVNRVEMCGDILCRSDELRGINEQLSNIEHIIERFQALKPRLYGKYSTRIYLPDGYYIDIPLTDDDIQPALTFLQQVYANTESRQASALKALFSAVQEAV